MSFLQKLIHTKKEAPLTEEQILQQIIAGHDYSVLPEFVYYPRAYEDGTIQPVENTVCPCCGKEVPYFYGGHFRFLEHKHGEEFKGVCPWCIASGAAARKFHGVFCKLKDITDVPEEIQVIIRERTPCFDGWKEEQWFSHCGDMMEYLGTAGYEELVACGSEEFLAALTAIAEEEVSWDGGKPESVLKRLDGDGSPAHFVDNGNVRQIPGKIQFPGYNEKWKRAVAADNGETLRVIIN